MEGNSGQKKWENFAGGDWKGSKSMIRKRIEIKSKIKIMICCVDDPNPGPILNPLPDLNPPHTLLFSAAFLSTGEEGVASRSREVVHQHFLDERKAQHDRHLVLHRQPGHAHLRHRCRAAAADVQDGRRVEGRRSDGEDSAHGGPGLEGPELRLTAR